ncbi:hypothetical protein GCM10020221_31670 [Streptomyces thioluteus]|uniref:Cation efflux protein cytoplasmic domain-containing protein n=1 Tax=Streptomyces thioluteus TaxID=66431 RepID=A0ABP6JJN5_STRTU
MHDLHVWEITSGDVVLSAHVIVEVGGDCHSVRRALQTTLREEYGITHATLQVDHAPAPLVGAGAVAARARGPALRGRARHRAPRERPPPTRADRPHRAAGHPGHLPTRRCGQRRAVGRTRTHPTGRPSAGTER